MQSECVCIPISTITHSGKKVTVVVVVRTRPRAIPLAKITTRKSTHGFPLSFSCMMSMGLRLAALRAAGAPLLYFTHSLQVYAGETIMPPRVLAQICGGNNCWECIINVEKGGIPSLKVFRNFMKETSHTWRHFTTLYEIKVLA